MKAFLATTCIVTGALLASGCATKKYVRNTAAPIQAKVDQVGEQSTQTAQQLQDAKTQLGTQLKDVDEKAQTGISAANERAASAGQDAKDAIGKAGDAMNKADQADQKGDQNAQGLSSLKQTVANLDDYKLQTTVSVPFQFNKAGLTKSSREDLDKLAQDVQADKRFFIAVEGFTDSTGTKSYNEMLSRQRANAVVEYLVAKHDIPIYRVHMIGLGPDKPVDEAHNRAARAKNRRVEVKVFSADQALTASSESPATRSQQ